MKGHNISYFEAIPLSSQFLCKTEVPYNGSVQFVYENTPIDNLEDFTCHQKCCVCGRCEHKNMLLMLLKQRKKKFFD